MANWVCFTKTAQTPSRNTRYQIRDTNFYTDLSNYVNFCAFFDTDFTNLHGFIAVSIEHELNPKE